jgi:hypothetical protein
VLFGSVRLARTRGRARGGLRLVVWLHLHCPRSGLPIHNLIATPTEASVHQTEGFPSVVGSYAPVAASVDIGAVFISELRDMSSLYRIQHRRVIEPRYASNYRQSNDEREFRLQSVDACCG